MRKRVIKKYMPDIKIENFLTNTSTSEVNVSTDEYAQSGGGSTPLYAPNEYQSINEQSNLSGYQQNDNIQHGASIEREAFIPLPESVNRSLPQNYVKESIVPPYSTLANFKNNSGKA